MDTDLQRVNQFLEIIEVFGTELLEVSEIDLRITLTVRTNVFLDGVGLRLEDTDTSAVKPILASIATDVELAFVVRSPTQTIQLIVLGFDFVTIGANILFGFLGLSFGQTDAVHVKPIGTEVAANHKPRRVVWFAAQTVQIA